MIEFYKILRLFGGIACKTTSGNNVKVWVQNGRMCTTEVKAIRPITVRTMRRSRRTNPYDVGSFVLMVIPVSSFGLGVWQVFRKFEKDAINDALIEKARKQPIVDLPMEARELSVSGFNSFKYTPEELILDKLKDMEFCSVRVKGKFDHSKELYLGPRPFLDENSSRRAISLLSNTNAGYLVVTPFKLSDRNLTILVNRGWVPNIQKLPETRPEGQISGEVELVGLVRNQQIRKPFGAENQPKRGLWVYRDIYKMAEVTGAAPVYIDATAESSVPGGPTGGQSLVEFKNDHLSYLVTWFSLSVASGYLWYVRHLQKLKGR